MSWEQGSGLQAPDLPLASFPCMHQYLFLIFFLNFIFCVERLQCGSLRGNKWRAGIEGSPAQNYRPLFPLLPLPMLYMAWRWSLRSLPTQTGFLTRILVLQANPSLLWELSWLSLSPAIQSCPPEAAHEATDSSHFQESTAWTLWELWIFNVLLFWGIVIGCSEAHLGLLICRQSWKSWIAPRQEEPGAGSGAWACVTVTVPWAQGCCQLGRDAVLGTKRSPEQAASLPSTDRAGRLQDPQAPAELLRLFHPWDTRPWCRGTRSPQKLRWGWWLLSCSLGVACASKNMEMWCLGMWFNNGLGSAELVAGLDDLGGVFPI